MTRPAPRNFAWIVGRAETRVGLGRSSVAQIDAMHCRQATTPRSTANYEKKPSAEIHVSTVATTLQRVRKPIGLALQGGGSWGAYTWGVLDVLLASRTISIAQLSGTSAGAINAAIVASALAKGSAAQARKSLRAFWLRVADPALADLARKIWGPAERSLRQSFGAWLLSSGAVTPYNANPLGINPLRDAIEAHVDIDAIRSKSSPALFVTVTNVKTGLPRVIANDAMSIDALLASACVPELFQAVELDGERYWDGGYCGNPTLWPMIHSGLADDLIVVQLAPEFAEVPTDGPGDTAPRRRDHIQFEPCRRDAGDHRDARACRAKRRYVAPARASHAPHRAAARRAPRARLVDRSARARGCSCFMDEGRIASQALPVRTRRRHRRARDPGRGQGLFRRSQAQGACAREGRTARGRQAPAAGESRTPLTEGYRIG